MFFTNRLFTYLQQIHTIETRKENMYLLWIHITLENTKLLLYRIDLLVIFDKLFFLDSISKDNKLYYLLKIASKSKDTAFRAHEEEKLTILINKIYPIKRKGDFPKAMNN